MRSRRPDRQGAAADGGAVRGDSIAQVAAVASLRDVAELTERVDALVAERARVAAALEDQGWKLPTSEANFLWFPLGTDSTDFSAACH